MKTTNETETDRQTEAPFIARALDILQNHLDEFHEEDRIAGHWSPESYDRLTVDFRELRSEATLTDGRKAMTAVSALVEECLATAQDIDLEGSMDDVCKPLTEVLRRLRPLVFLEDGDNGRTVAYAILTEYAEDLKDCHFNPEAGSWGTETKAAADYKYLTYLLRRLAPESLREPEVIYRDPRKFLREFAHNVQKQTHCNYPRIDKDSALRTIRIASEYMEGAQAVEEEQ